MNQSGQNKIYINKINSTATVQDIIKFRLVYFFIKFPFLPHQLKPAQLIQQRTRFVISVVVVAVEV